MRQPYKLFGVPLQVDKWQTSTRADLGDVDFPTDARIPMLGARMRKTNDILAQLGDLGLGCPMNIYFPALPDISVGILLYAQKYRLL